MKYLAAFCSTVLWILSPLGANAQSAQALNVDLNQLSVSNISRDELDRYMAASMVYSMPDQNKILAYEMVTRCSIEISTRSDGASMNSPTLRSMGRDYVSAVAPSIAANTAVELAAMLSGASQPQQDWCTNRIRGYFGSQYEIDSAELRPLAQRAIAILNGAALDQGANRITDPTARGATEAARARVATHIKTPLFVGAIRAPGQVAVLIGEPGAAVRWIVQFAEAQGAYVLEGGVEAGVSDDSQ